MPLITWSDGERHGILVASWRCLESGLGMWNDVRLTEHRLQIRPSDIELHNWWLNYFQLLDVWSKFHRFVIVLYYTDSCAWKRNILFMARRLVGSWKPILQHVPCRISCILPERTWQQTSHMAGGHVPPTGPGHPLCQRLAAVQRNRWLAKAGWQMMAQAFNWPGPVGGSASLSQKCGLQTRLLENSDLQEFLRSAHWRWQLVHKNSLNRRGS